MVFNNSIMMKFILYALKNITLCRNLHRPNHLTVCLFVLSSIFSFEAQGQNDRRKLVQSVSDHFFNPYTQTKFQKIQVKTTNNGLKKIEKFVYALDTNFQTECEKNRLSILKTATGRFPTKEKHCLNYAYKPGDLLKYIHSGIPKPAYDYVVNEAFKVYEGTREVYSNQDYTKIALNPFYFLDDLAESRAYREDDTLIGSDGKLHIYGYEGPFYDFGGYFNDVLWSHGSPSFREPIFKSLPPEHFSRIFNLTNPSETLELTRFGSTGFWSAMSQGKELLPYGYFSNQSKNCSYPANIMDIAQETERQYNRGTFSFIYDLYGNGEDTRQQFSLLSDREFRYFLVRNADNINLNKLMTQTFVQDFWIAVDSESMQCEIYKKMKPVILWPYYSSHNDSISTYKYSLDISYKLTETVTEPRVISSLVDAFLLQGRVQQDTNIHYIYQKKDTTLIKKYTPVTSQVNWNIRSISQSQRIPTDNFKEITKTDKKTVYSYRDLIIKLKYDSKHNLIKRIVIKEQKNILPNVISQQRFKYYEL
jgi:hypothetical protein